MDFAKTVGRLVVGSLLATLGIAQEEEAAASAGEVAWVFAPDGAWFGGLTCGDGVVYALERGGFVHALDAETGEQLWKSKTKRRCDQQFGIELPRGAQPPGLCFSSDDGLSLLDRKTGKELWHVDVSGLDGPACTEDAVVAGSSDGSIYAFSLRDGSLLWQHDYVEDAEELEGANGHGARFAGKAARPGHASTDGTIVVLPVFDQGRAVAVDAKTGARLWAFETKGWMGARPTFGPRNVMLGSQDKHIYAVDKITGQLVSKHETGGSLSGSARATERFAFVGSCDARLYCVDQVVGHVKWRYETEHDQGFGAPIYSRPLLLGDTVYLAAMRGKLYAVDRRTGAERWKMTPMKDSEPNSDLFTDGKRLFLSVRRDGKKGVGAVVAIDLPGN